MGITAGVRLIVQVHELQVNSDDAFRCSRCRSHAEFREQAQTQISDSISTLMRTWTPQNRVTKLHWVQVPKPKPKPGLWVSESKRRLIRNQTDPQKQQNTRWCTTCSWETYKLYISSGSLKKIQLSCETDTTQHESQQAWMKRNPAGILSSKCPTAPSNSEVVTTAPNCCFLILKKGKITIIATNQCIFWKTLIKNTLHQWFSNI